MSYADLEIKTSDHDLIESEITKLTYDFGVRTNEQYTGNDCLLSINPTHPKEIVAQFQYNNQDQILNNLRGAKEVQDYWADELDWVDRHHVMSDFKKEAEKIQHRLTAAIVLETGKSQHESFAEVREFLELMDYYLYIYSRDRGLVFPMELESVKHTSSDNVYRPFGTFVCITPFNFPVAMAGMCFGALLTGNTVVWKPAPETPLTDYLLYSCFPVQDVFNFVVAEEELFGKVILGNPNFIDGLAFTGSTDVGFRLAREINKVDRQNGAVKVIAETGGNNSCIVTPSANIKDAGWGVAKSAFGACAQKCSACGRAVVHKSVAQQFIAATVAASEEMFVMGDPRYREVTLGPVIHDKAQAAYGRYLQNRPSGVGLIYPNIKRKFHNVDGYFVDPVIMTNLSEDHDLCQNELFVPILRIQEYDGGIEEAVRIANNTKHGLTAGIFTEDEKEKNYFFKKIQAGVTYANRRGGATTGAWPTNHAFGGWKNSGWCTQHGVCGPHYLFNFVRGQTQYDATERS